MSVVMIGAKDVINLGKYHLLKANAGYTVLTLCGLRPKANKHGWIPSPDRINFDALVPNLKCSRCEIIERMRKRKETT